MGRNALAIRKGMSAEYLAKAHFSKQGYLIISPDSHETSFDFLIHKGNEVFKVQVKAVLELEDFKLARIRNKHGANNKSYKQSDYDILAGVWIDKNLIYLFKTEDVNEIGFGETISVSKLDGSKLNNRKRPVSYYEGSV